MNPKKEFVKAIISVLRLEDNIYTTGAIEKIIERLKVSDYQMFIAFLGERKSDYEKPIESIAKGVDEFYTKKLEPHRQKALETQYHILNAFNEIRKHIHKMSKKLIDEEKLDKYIFEHYGKQSQEIQDANKHDRRITLSREIAEEKIEKFFNEKKKDDDFWKGFIVSETKEPVINNDHLDIIYKIGLEKFSQRLDYSTLIFDYIYTKNVKPSISEQIIIKEVEKIYEPEQIAYKTKEVLQLANKVEWTE